MGYRTYIASMPKREYNKIKSMTKEQLIEFYDIEKEDGDFWYKGVYEYGTELYCFGKYTDFNPPKKSLKPFFKNKDLMKIYDEYEFFIATKDFLEYLIGTYEEKIKNYYNEMLEPFLGTKNNIFDKESPEEFLNSVKVEYGYPKNKYKFDFSKITQEQQNSLFNIIEHVRNMRIEWTHIGPYDLHRGLEITNSWKYEYGIFELIRIYKSFDWKKNVLIYYGY